MEHITRPFHVLRRRLLIGLVLSVLVLGGCGNPVIDTGPTPAAPGGATLAPTAPNAVPTATP